MSKKMRQFEWAVVDYEGGQYDVCVGMEVEEVEEIHVIGKAVDISPVMRVEVMDWMLDQALADIHWSQGEASFVDMNAKARKIEGY